MLGMLIQQLFRKPHGGPTIERRLTLEGWTASPLKRLNKLQRQSNWKATNERIVWDEMETSYVNALINRDGCHHVMVEE